MVPEILARVVTAVAIAVATVCSAVVAIAFVKYAPSAIATAAADANAFTIANAMVMTNQGIVAVLGFATVVAMLIQSVANHEDAIISSMLPFSYGC